nr:NAD(P)-binding domain-containing protein [Mycobacterium uberis]
MAPLVEIGTTEATALSDMTDIDIISVAVLDSEQVREIVAGESKLDLKTKPSNIVAIHFTISDTTVVNLARKIAPQGIRVVVAPLVSGGSAVVAKGELVTRVGVDDEKFQRSKEPFQRWASLVVHVGELGAGARMKMARNMLTFVSYTAAAEALQLAGRLRIGHRGTWENFAAQQSSDRWRRSVHVPQC